MILTDPVILRERLASARTIAVLGAHSEPSRPAFYVPDYLFRQGYRVLPVNPALTGAALWGEGVGATLSAFEQDDVDIVDVFRRGEALPGHVDEVLACTAAQVARGRGAPLVWFQQGIVNNAVANQLSAAGVDVVQDRCTLADHRAWGIARIVKPERRP